MSMRLVAPLVALAFVVVLIVSGTFFIVDPTEQALVLQFGAPVRAPIREPGLQVKWPLVQNVVFYDKRLLYLEPAELEITASDQKRLRVDSYARYRIVSPLQFYQTVGTEASANTRLASIINSTLRLAIGNVPLASVVAEKRAAVMQEVRVGVNEQAKNFGIEVIDVRIRRADLPRQNSDAIYERMKTERQREAQQFRGEGQGEATKISADADRQVVEIKAEAAKQSQILRGEADAETVKIYADAFGRDPEFFSFYRSLEAYRTSLTGQNTTFVLSPDSEFFRFFGSANGSGVPGGNPPKP